MIRFSVHKEINLMSKIKRMFACNGILFYFLLLAFFLDPMFKPSQCMTFAYFFFVCSFGCFFLPSHFIHLSLDLLDLPWTDRQLFDNAIAIRISEMVLRVGNHLFFPSSCWCIRLVSGMSEDEKQIPWIYTVLYIVCYYVSFVSLFFCCATYFVARTFVGIFFSSSPQFCLGCGSYK